MKKIEAATISTLDSSSRVETKKPSVAETSLMFTEAAAGAVSNSSSASVALLNLPSSTLKEGVNTADAEIQEQRGNQWLAKQKEVDSLIDDAKIKDTVTALQVNGFNTRQSCEGHIGHACGAPWVDIEAAGGPELIFGLKGDFVYFQRQYEGQEEAFQQAAAKNGISVEDMLSRSNWEKYRELCRETNRSCYNNSETPEFKEWRQKNKDARKSMEDILTKYYQTKNVPEAERIHFMNYEDSSVRIYTGTKEDLYSKWESMSDNDKQALGERLESNRRAMNKFTQFLKEYFMANGPAVTGQ
ncbi:MAG: hypothetical protein AB9903_24425 [Vulcanimicrobiota bacterium]